MFCVQPSEGALYEGELRGPNWGKDVTQGGQHVLPGDEWVYIWDVGEQFNELDVNEFGSKFWFYHSHIIEPIDTNTGLVGPIIITKSGFETSDDDPTPIDVDREFITLFTVFDENISWMIPFNLKHHLNSSNPYYKKYNDTYVNYIMEYDSDDDDFHESNLMHSMNGFTWNTMSKHLGVNNKIKLGERIRWYIGTIGTEEVGLCLHCVCMVFVFSLFYFIEFYPKKTTKKNQKKPKKKHRLIYIQHIGMVI